MVTNAKKMRDDVWLWGLIALLCVLIVPLVYALMGEADGDIARYRSEGRVGQGEVTGVRAVNVNYTGRGGRPRTRTDHYIDISYDLYPTVSYADYVRAGEVLPPGNGSGNRSSYSRSSSESEAEAHGVGQAVAVVVRPDDPFKPNLYTSVRDYVNWPNYLLMLGALFASAFCGWRALVSWRALKALQVQPMQSGA